MEEGDLDNSPLHMMERTLKITVQGTRIAMQSVNRRMILDIFKESDVLAV